MNLQLRGDDLRKCENYLKDPDSETPEILKALKIQEIRLLLQSTAESIIKSDETAGTDELRELFVFINDQYPLNKHEESPKRCNETFRKGTSGEWE